jgi:hypothetical protein
MVPKLSRRLLPLTFTVFSLFSVLGLTPGLKAESNDDNRLARISYLEGQVSFMHPKDVDWTAASVNMPLQPLDRVYTGTDGRLEIEFDEGSVIRLAERTDLEVLALNEDLIQLQVLTGLSTLTVRSGIRFEVNTPAAAFTAERKGVYRFDVAENGDSDAIVRKGRLEAVNNQFSREINSEEVIHVTPGDTGTHTVASYDGRDAWDEWNDRRSADTQARTSRQYLPDDVYIGAADLDRYGRWVTVADYGVAWIPVADAGWSPYWDGRWVYRPFWGWTWVSYEPWGWLPYHYGRWYHTSLYGWCWLPGPFFSFHFWSPGLVRFYNGPSHVAWMPLGPGDYYNVHNYYYPHAFGYQLNQMEGLHHRAPEDLVNRGVPNALRAVDTQHFLTSSFGPGSRVPLVSVPPEQIGRERMVSDRLSLRPAPTSYAPAPERTITRPGPLPDRPVVVRTEPSVRDSGGARFIRANPPGREMPGGGIHPQSPGTEPSPGILNRRAPDSDASRQSPGRVLQAPQPGSRPENPRTRPEVKTPRSTAPSNPRSTPDVPRSNPNRSAPGTERTRPQEPSRPKEDAKPRREPGAESSSYVPRNYGYSGVTSNSWAEPRASYSRGNNSVIVRSFGPATARSEMAGPTVERPANYQPSQASQYVLERNGGAGQPRVVPLQRTWSPGSGPGATSPDTWNGRSFGTPERGAPRQPMGGGFGAYSLSNGGARMASPAPTPRTGSARVDQRSGSSAGGNASGIGRRR